MKKILITGANGQLGIELKKLSTEFSTFSYIFIDIDSLDLTDNQAFTAFFNKNHFDYIINCAAYTAVDKAETEPEKAFEINAVVPARLTEISKNDSCRLIHLSTDYVFDGKTCIPYVETDAVSPQSVYGQSKLNGENEVLKNKENIVIRTSWLYSANGNNFLKTMLKLGNEKEMLNVVFDQVGTPTSASDLAHAIMVICDKIDVENKNYGGIYHYSNEGVCSWYDFAVEIMELAGLNCKVLPITTSQYPLPAKRPAYSVLNKSKIKSVFGIEIPHWKKSLKELIMKLK
jgi:dTDP-4-dehydrorhamnose reductase